jgi:hypothetical protein
MTAIQCQCKRCKANAESLGLTIPLRAEAPAALVAAVGGKVHGLVHMAHDPNAITGAAARARTGVRAL